MAISLPMIDNKTILTATGGFLQGGFTHTINPASGCPYGSSVCGVYCYAQHNRWVTKDRPWGLYGFKKNVVELYRKEYDALRRPRRSEPKPLRIFMSSSTDPYPPQKIGRQFTRALLEEMKNRPPDTLVIQTRSPLVASDLELIATLAGRFELWVSITVETDMDRLPGLPNHATPIPKRIAALKAFRERGVPTQAAVSPLLPLADPERFAATLSESCDRVILDHYLLGDGSRGALRTKRTRFPEMLEAAGFGEWNDLGKFWEIKAVFDRILGPARVLVSAEGFNAVGKTTTKEDRNPLTSLQRISPSTAGPPNVVATGPSQIRVPEASLRKATLPRDRPEALAMSHVTPSLDYIVENRKSLLAQLDRRLGVVRDYVRGVAHNYATGLYLFGMPGTAKTSTVRAVLEAELREPYVYQRGHLTPLGLFELIAEHPEEVIVLDDLSTVFKSDVALQVLLSALEHPTTADRSRRVTYRRQGREECATFRRGIICISNRGLHDDELLNAFKSRVHTLNYNPTDAQLGALMLGIADRGWPVAKPAISPEECGEIAHFVIAEMLRLGCRFDLRFLVNKAFPDYQQVKDNEAESDWRDLITASIEEHLVELKHETESPASRAARKEEEHEIVRSLIREYATREEQLGEWVRRTGKSERAFYRRLAEVDNH